ncbi:MAG: hypothetical protein ACYTGG_11630 [Planctomycetota bacterium]|jgi:hypothetical protein
MNEQARARAGRALPAHVLAASWGALLIIVGLAAFDGTAMLLAAGTGAVCMVLSATGLISRCWRTSVFGALLVTALGALGAGLVAGSASIGAAGLVGLIVAAAAAALAWQLDAMPAGGGTAEASTLPRTEHLLHQIHEHVLLSDTAKRVLFRDRELLLLRRAIEEQITAGDYDAAATLCDDMAELFGRREEAEQFRERILLVRQEHDEARIMAALGQLDDSLATRNWAQAHQDAARIKRLYPDSHLLLDVDQRIDRARQEHKHDLVQQFLDAAEHDDTEAAMRLLRELDRYMTRQEAEQLSSVAERVVTRRRDALGEAFKLAINEHRWSDAAQLGESIIEEFPRSRMSHEVRAMIEMIRGRASSAAVVSEPPT